MYAFSSSTCFFRLWYRRSKRVALSLACCIALRVLSSCACRSEHLSCDFVSLPSSAEAAAA